MNSKRIRFLPRTVYDDLGGLEESERDCLILGWMHSGVARTEKTVETKRGTVTIPRGHVWGSYERISKDIHASTGLYVTTDALEYTITRSRYSKTQRFIQDSELVFPETRGHYGKLWRLDDVFVEGTSHVHLARLFQMFKYGDPKEFYMAEQVAGTLGENARRGTYRNGNTWMTWVAEEGFDRPAFVSVGRWRSGEEGEWDTPVYIPWITFDIDAAGEVLDAKEQAVSVVERLDASGYDPSRIFVSFSGSKGFHVQVSTAQIGHPIFADSEAAQVFMKVFMEDIAPDIYDPAVTSPHSLVRLTGSQHEKTGAYKTTWTADEFLALSTEEVFAGIREHSSFEWVDPRQQEAEEEALEHARSVAMNARNMEPQKKQDQGNQFGHVGPVIDAIRGGIEEGEVFGDKHFHVGRENAAFIMGCWYLDRNNDRISWQKLQKWNERNKPPLPRRRLQAQFKGSRRKLGRR